MCVILMDLLLNYLQAQVKCVIPNVSTNLQCQSLR